MSYLTEEEVENIKGLKTRGVLRNFTLTEFRSLTVNGGVGLFCSDGDIDAFKFHNKAITKRPHSVKIFGGSLFFARSFPGYNEEFEKFLFENMSWGMAAKTTSTVCCYPHFPCGVAKKFNLSIKDVLWLACESVAGILDRSKPFFTPKKIISFFHVKKMIDGREEQNTYLFHPEFY